MDLLEHLASNLGDSLEGGGAGLGLHLLESGLDGIDGGVAQRTHGTGHETDESGLVAGEVAADVLGLVLVQPLLEVGVGSEVHGLVAALSERGERDTSVERTEPLLFDDGVESVGGVAVLGHIEGIGHGVVLRLETNLDDLHGSDDGNGLGHTGRETGKEEGLAGNNTGLLVGEELLVPLERGEADGHLGNDTSEHGTETLVQTKGGLLLNDLDTSADEAALGLARYSAALGKLHAHLDGVKRMADQGLHHTSTTTSCFLSSAFLVPDIFLSQGLSSPIKLVAAVAGFFWPSLPPDTFVAIFAMFSVCEEREVCGGSKPVSPTGWLCLVSSSFVLRSKSG